VWQLLFYAPAHEQAPSASLVLDNFLLLQQRSNNNFLTNLRDKELMLRRHSAVECELYYSRFEAESGVLFYIFCSFLMDVLAAVTVHLIFAFMLTRRESGHSLAATPPFCVNNFKCPVLQSQSHIYIFIYIEEVKLAPFLKNFSLP
jgi:hypothetical protein